MLLVAFAASAQQQESIRRRAEQASAGAQTREQMASARTGFAAACAVDAQWHQITDEIAKSETRLKEVRLRLSEEANREGLRVMAKQSKGGQTPVIKALSKVRAQEETLNAGLRLQRVNREWAIKQLRGEVPEAAAAPRPVTQDVAARLTTDQVTARNAAAADKRVQQRAAELKSNQDLAAEGDADGQLRMGERYLTGDGVEEDKAKRPGSIF